MKSMVPWEGQWCSDGAEVSNMLDDCSIFWEWLVNCPNCAYCTGMLLWWEPGCCCVFALLYNRSFSFLQGEAMFDSVNIDELDDESSFDRQSVVAPSCHADALQIHRAATHEIMNCEDWSLISKSSHNWCMTCRPVPMFSLWPVPEYSFTETFSAFCLGPRQRTSAQVPIVNRLVELGVRRFCIAAYKARSGEHTCQCPSVTVCWWMWSMSNWIDLPFLNLIGFFHYRWLWQRSVCGSSRRASTASDTQRSSNNLVNLIHVVHFGNLWNNDIYVRVSYDYAWIIFIQGNHIVGVLTLLSTDHGRFMALQATRLDYFMQLQKEVMTATSSAKFRTERQMPLRYHPFSCMATSGRKEWKNNGCSDLAAIAYFIFDSPLIRSLHSLQ